MTEELAKLTHNGRVWSGPLSRHLGPKKYQKFIVFQQEFYAKRWRGGRKYDDMAQESTSPGFDPKLVEKFLRNGKG